MRTWECYPAAGLFALLATQIDILDGFEPFLIAVIVVGIIQIAMGIARAGELSSFFPSSVIKGLLTAIGVLSCIDSRVPAELVLDLGIGDIFASEWPATSLAPSHSAVQNTAGPSLV